MTSSPVLRYFGFRKSGVPALVHAEYKGSSENRVFQHKKYKHDITSKTLDDRLGAFISV
jgi:hypothetical protein